MLLYVHLSFETKTKAAAWKCMCATVEVYVCYYTSVFCYIFQIHKPLNQLNILPPLLARSYIITKGMDSGSTKYFSGLTKETRHAIVSVLI